MRLLYVAGCHQNQHHVQSHGAGLRAPAVRSGGGARPDGRDHPGDERADGDQTPERPALREPPGDGDSGRLLANHVLVLQIAGTVLPLDHAPERALPIHLPDFHPIGSRLIQRETRDSLPRPFRIRRGTQRHAGVDELREVGHVPLAPV